MAKSMIWLLLFQAMWACTPHIACIWRNCRATLDGSVMLTNCLRRAPHDPNGHPTRSYFKPSGFALTRSSTTSLCPLSASTTVQRRTSLTSRMKASILWGHSAATREFNCCVCSRHAASASLASTTICAACRGGLPAASSRWIPGWLLLSPK